MFPIDGQPGLSSNTYKHHSLLISRHGNKIRNNFFRFEIQYGFQEMTLNLPGSGMLVSPLFQNEEL